MNRGRNVIGGSTGAPLQFTPASAEDVPGVRLEPKVCELCSKVFFREARERECKPCAARIAAAKEKIAMPLPLPQADHRGPDLQPRKSRSRCTPAERHERYLEYQARWRVRNREKRLQLREFEQAAKENSSGRRFFRSAVQNAVPMTIQ
ncbi:MAG: hypothetical protein WA708_00070 [Acidobacteriaceae bacterium]